MLVNGPHTSSNLVFSLLPVPLCEPLINIEIGFPLEHMGTHNSAESPKKEDSSEYLQPPNCVATAPVVERGLTR